MTEAARGQGARGAFVSRLAEAISSVATTHPLRVARPPDHADVIVYNDRLDRPSWEVRPDSAIRGL